MKKITVTELTDDEKLRLICGQDFWHTADLNGKIPQITLSDGPVGLRIVRERAADGSEKSYPAIAYPSIQLLANTWDPACAEAMGKALGDDCLEQGVDILLAPGVNLKRHPLNGRNFEYFSEDPYLAGTLAKHYIAGVQSRGIGVTLKHFCCNNLEYDRLHQSSDVDERTLREVYYRPFEIACEAKPVAVMCSYNRINGKYAAEYKKGFDVLRNEFGFDGAIVSDWSAVRDRTKSAEAGLDLEMPFNEKNYLALCKDFEEGKLSDDALNACAGRVLDLIYRCKAMREGKRAESAAGERVAVAQEVASEGMVLLKNNGVLPLKNIHNLSVAGCYAMPDRQGMLRGSGSAAVEWSDQKFNLNECLEKRGFSVRYESAFRYDEVDSFSQNVRAAAQNAYECDVSIVCVGLGEKFEREGADRASMRLPRVQEQAILQSASQNPNTVVVIFAGSAIDIKNWADKVAAILFAGYPGMGGDEVIADILTGATNPSGKLSETFPLNISDVPAARIKESAGYTRYSEGLDIGYRYFDTYDIPTLFPFGYGLSYSEYRYKNLHISADGENVKVRYEIENMSDTDGKEISQIYMRECLPLVYRPRKELKGYAKTFVCANGKAEISVDLDIRAFSHWSVSEDRWIADDGDYEILIGASCADIRLSQKICIRDGKIVVPERF